MACWTVARFERTKQCKSNLTVVSRVRKGNGVQLNLSNGESLTCRRFIPIGKGDQVCRSNENLLVLARYDNTWIDVGCTWTRVMKWRVGKTCHEITFKEIESEHEFLLFDTLRKFHYRGGGGVGRVAPLIAVTETWDLPYVLGFIEITSSMIANTARKQFFDYPYREDSGHGWLTWDRAATKKYSNMIARISRFVIHPEIRGTWTGSTVLDGSD